MGKLQNFTGTCPFHR